MSTKSKKKIGTVLDGELYRALKVYAATENKPISEIIEEAISQYIKLEKHNFVEESFGAMKTESEVLREILEEDFYEQ